VDGTKKKSRDGSRQANTKREGKGASSIMCNLQHLRQRDDRWRTKSGEGKT